MRFAELVEDSFLVFSFSLFVLDFCEDEETMMLVTAVFVVFKLVALSVFLVANEETEVFLLLDTEAEEVRGRERVLLLSVSMRTGSSADVVGTATELDF